MPPRIGGRSEAAHRQFGLAWTSAGQSDILNPKTEAAGVIAYHSGSNINRPVVAVSVYSSREVLARLLAHRNPEIPLHGKHDDGLAGIRGR